MAIVLVTFALLSVYSNWQKAHLHQIEKITVTVPPPLTPTPTPRFTPDPPEH